MAPDNWRRYGVCCMWNQFLSLIRQGCTVIAWAASVVLVLPFVLALWATALFTGVRMPAVCCLRHPPERATGQTQLSARSDRAA
jgi:hypothetical protein